MPLRANRPSFGIAMFQRMSLLRMVGVLTSSDDGGTIEARGIHEGIGKMLRMMIQYTMCRIGRLYQKDQRGNDYATGRYYV
jgi:hypothetical protein